MATTGLEGGFANAPVQSAQTFRAVLNAMAHPGRIETVSAAQPPLPMDPAAGAMLLTLADHETKIFLAPSVDSDAIRSWLTFHTGAPLVARVQLILRSATGTNYCRLTNIRSAPLPTRTDRSRWSSRSLPSPTRALSFADRAFSRLRRSISRTLRCWISMRTAARLAST